MAKFGFKELETSLCRAM